MRSGEKAHGEKAHSENGHNEKTHREMSPDKAAVRGGKPTTTASHPQPSTSQKLRSHRLATG